MRLVDDPAAVADRDRRNRTVAGVVREVSAATGGIYVGGVFVEWTAGFSAQFQWSVAQSGIEWIEAKVYNRSNPSLVLGSVKVPMTDDGRKLILASLVGMLTAMEVL